MPLPQLINARPPQARSYSCGFHLWRAPRAPFFGPLELNGIDSPVAQGSLRPVQHLRDREEIGVRTNSTIKYEFILRSDWSEFPCRGALGSRRTQRIRRSSRGKKRAQIRVSRSRRAYKRFLGKTGIRPGSSPGLSLENAFSAASRKWRAGWRPHGRELFRGGRKQRHDRVVSASEPHALAGYDNANDKVFIDGCVNQTRIPVPRYAFHDSPRFCKET
jgi:hypothetical protein